MEIEKDLGKVIPEAGVDYYTDAEKAALKAELEAEFATEIAGKEDSSNKVTLLTPNSTNTQYPGAKTVYDELVQKEKEIDLLKSQYESKEVEGDNLLLTNTSNLVIKNIELEGNMLQDETPEPTSPVPIQVITGDNTITFMGKNLIDISDGNWELGSWGTDGSATSSNQNARGIPYISCKPNTRYTISTNTPITNIRFNEYDANKNHIQRDAESITNSFTITTGANTYYLRWSFNYNNSSTVTQDILNSIDLQMEVGSGATTYTPYQLQTQLISLGDIELTRMASSIDRIYKDNNKWWLEKNVRKDVSNGTENWSVVNTGTDNWYYKRGINSRYRTTAVISNMYNYLGEIKNDNTIQGISLSYATSTSSTIKIRYGTEDTIDNFKTFLSNNNLITYCRYYEPVITEITDATLVQQLNNIANFNTCNGLTQISFTTENLTPIAKIQYYTQDTIKQSAEIKMLYDQIPTYIATDTSINVKDSSNLPIKDFALLGNASQNGTPTPDSPVPIQVVTGDNTLYFAGKNLYNINATADGTRYANYSVTGQNITVSATTSTTNGRVWWNIPVEVGKTYTISYDSLTEVGENASNKVQYGFSSTKVTSYTDLPENDISKTNKYVTVTATAKFLIVILRVASTSATTSVTFRNLQAEVGIPSSYEAYITPQTQLISLGDIELVKIGTYQDRIYKSYGKWYREEIIKKFTLNGTETWTKSWSGSANWFYQYASSQTPLDENILPYSNYFPGAIVSSTSTDEGIWITNTKSIRVRYGTEDTIENFITWLTTHNIDLYYVKKTPTTTEITDTTLILQLENVLKMSTYKNETNAFSIVASGNEEGELQIQYRQDLQTLFNNLSNAIISLGGNV